MVQIAYREKSLEDSEDWLLRACWVATRVAVKAFMFIQAVRAEDGEESVAAVCR